MPRDDAFDSTLALLADPYCFISKRCERLHSDLFQARIMLRRTVCMSGPKAAELFYDRRRFIRQGAAPEPLRATLFGKGAVQTLDGDAHQRRKAMFMSLVTPERVALLANEVAEGWRQAATDWHRSQRRVVLYGAAQRLLTRAVCAWAGVPLPEQDVRLRARQLSALFDEAASLHHLRSRAARRQAEQWLAGLVDDVRAGRLRPLAGSALEVIATHRSLDGTLLPPRLAAAELLNVLRPTVAVSAFIVFAAHALHEYPQSLALLQRGDARDIEHFVQEVRRFYPFFPAVVARSREEFEWEGYSFRQGQRVMLDLYGTNHDPRAWNAPHEFRPERFRGHAPGAFEFVPQGGGDAQQHHRCPGEGVAVALMKVSVEFLARRLGYEVPPQDLRINFARLPALPHSHFVMRDVTPLPNNAWGHFAFTPG
jgi:fatty-acid peroxygenase